MILTFQVLVQKSKVVSTHRTGTHPFRNLYQQAFSVGIPFIIGVAGGAAIVEFNSGRCLLFDAKMTNGKGWNPGEP